MNLPNRLFFTGVPGSKWSGIAQYLSKIAQVNNSDQSPSRQYEHQSYTGHKGSYFGKGMEFDSDIDDLIYPEGFVDSPFATKDGMKIIKSHDWAYKLPTIKRLFPNDWIMLVYRSDLQSFAWWHDAGGFNISYPCYDAYGDSINMLNEIIKQNEGILEFAYDNNATWSNFTSAWVKEHFNEDIEIKEQWKDILVTIIM